MPATYLYATCLMAYLALMAVGLVLSAFLFLVPSKRRLALRLCLGILASLPAMLVFQIAAGIVLGALLAAVLEFYALFHPPESVQWSVDIPTILIMFVSFAAASFGGCYTGAQIGWQTGGGAPFRVAFSEQKAVRFVSLWFRKGRA